MGASAIARKTPPAELMQGATYGGLYRDTLIDWAVIVGLFFVALNAPWWTYPVVAYLLAGRFHALAVIMHDLGHLRFEKKGLRERVLEVLCGYSINWTIELFRYSHNRHHDAPNQLIDPYFNPGMVGNKWHYFSVWARQSLSLPAWFARGPAGLAGALFSPWLREKYARAFLRDKSDDDLRQSEEVMAVCRAELGQCIFLLIPTTLTVFFPIEMLLCYWIPQEVGWMVAGYRYLTEHTYAQCDEKTPGVIMATTIDHHIDPIGQLAVAPHNVGYHICHHLHPNVGYRHLPALQAWYREEYGEAYPLVREGLILRTVKGWFGRRERLASAE